MADKEILKRLTKVCIDFKEAREKFNLNIN